MPIPRNELLKLAQARIQDATALANAKRYDGAVYLCGYAVELALKAKICFTLNWAEGFPATNREFEKYKSFRTHDLDVLLRLTGVELKIKTEYWLEWATVTFWDPESRYKPVGTSSVSQAQDMLEAAQVLVRALQ